jgi:hypothetical protein
MDISSSPASLAFEPLPSSATFKGSGLRFA